MAAVAATIYRVQEPRRQEMTVAWRLYSNQPIIGLSPRTYNTRTPGVRYNAQGLNLAHACTDAYTSLITKDEPRSWFDVVGGDRQLKKRAKQMQSFIDGVNAETNRSQLRLRTVRDTGIFGQGITKICRSNEFAKPRIQLWRRNPWQILVDEQEAAEGNPANIYEMMWIDKRVLMAMYPKLAAEIRSASSSAYMDTPSGSYTDTNFLDFAVVVEGWHRPRVAGPAGTNDGRRSLIVGQLVLEDEPYTWHRFPFEWNYRDVPVQGLYGQGIPNEIAPVQLEINRVMRTISQSQRLAVGHWFIEQGSDVNTNAINDIVASIVRYSGTKPEYIQYPPVSQDVYQYLWMLWQKGFESLGISQMAAMAMKPPGLNASVAIDTYADVQSDRYKPAYKLYQEWDKRVTEQILHLGRELSEEDPDFEVTNKTTKSMMATVRLADVLLKDDEFNLRIKEINQLGDDVPEKLQTVSDFTSAGLFDPDDGKRMLLEDGGMPDLVGYESLEAAAYNFVEMCADAAIEDAKYIQPNVYLAGPDGTMKLPISRMRKFYLKASCDGVPDENLKLLRQWMEEAANIMPPPPPPPPPPGAPAPGAPHPGGPLALAKNMAPPPPPPMAGAA